ncbi:MAG: hypothetical protein ABEI13_02350, partial [Candidatus Paceibacteria bacterium]
MLASNHFLYLRVAPIYASGYAVYLAAMIFMIIYGPCRVNRAELKLLRNPNKITFLNWDRSVNLVRLETFYFVYPIPNTIPNKITM